ncbi:hypothetical protein [Nostoc sp.]
MDDNIILARSYRLFTIPAIAGTAFTDFANRLGVNGKAIARQ